jgi:cobalamin-dependent methionine synthase I
MVNCQRNFRNFSSKYNSMMMILRLSTSTNKLTTNNFLTLRQQSQKTVGAPNIALADFIAPKDSGKQDYIGCFCVTTGFGVDEKASEFEKQLDDYNSILVKALGR